MRLVLCDDNRILCEALAVALKARGHQVLATATDSTAGIAEVERHRPDACLLDLRFPDPPDGLGAARVIRERCPETAVLVLSGHADPAVLAEATELGVAGVLRKDQYVDHIAGALDVIASGGVVYGPVKAHATRSHSRYRYHPVRDLTSREKEVLRRVFLRRYTGKDYTMAALLTQTQRYVTRRTLLLKGKVRRMGMRRT